MYKVIHLSACTLYFGKFGIFRKILFSHNLVNHRKTTISNKIYIFTFVCTFLIDDIYFLFHIFRKLNVSSISNVSMQNRIIVGNKHIIILIIFKVSNDYYNCITLYTHAKYFEVPRDGFVIMCVYSPSCLFYNFIIIMVRMIYLDAGYCDEQVPSPVFGFLTWGGGKVVNNICSHVENLGCGGNDIIMIDRPILENW